MSIQPPTTQSIEPDAKWLYRVGGIAGLVFGIAYIAIIALYVPIGAPPQGAEARLNYHGANPTVWWAILGLSVLTDLLLVPVALALYVALKAANRNLMLLAVSFIGLFVILDLAITWTNYGALITLGSAFVAATDAAYKAALLTAAIYPTTVLESNLVFVYNTLTLSIGILLAGWVMLKGNFGKAAAYVGLATGIFGIVAVFGPLLVSALSATIILASLLTTLWALFAGYKLLRLH
jgi:hypothetical protein